jgi:hypothetical protein
MSKPSLLILLVLSLLSTAALAQPDGSSPTDAFWANLQALCGQAFAGRVDAAPPGDTAFADKELVMHLRQCGPQQLRIPFHVGADRSRTWVLTRTDEGILLKHDHRHEDGSEDAITQYGGHTSNPGQAQAQIFPADAFTASLLPAAFSNVWMMELVPGEYFAYSLRRMGTERHFRVVFDLRQAVPLPPAPWGSEE